MKTKTTLIGLTLVYFCTNIRVALSVPNSSPEPETSKPSVQEVVNRLVGVMDTSKQAQTNPQVAKVRMTTCLIRVSPRVENAVFLYQEQAVAGKLSQPYRQRFLRISITENGKFVESAGFKPPKTESWKGFCDRTADERVISRSDLGKNECSVFLHKEGDNYVGETQPGGCPTKFKGAVKVTNQVTLHSRGMDTWDRGYDERGNLIWGAKQEPYQYLWVSKSALSR